MLRYRRRHSAIVDGASVALLAAIGGAWVSAMPDIFHDFPIKAPPPLIGLANPEGTELLALDSVSNPTQIRGAVCAGARVYRVAYARRHSGGRS